MVQSSACYIFSQNLLLDGKDKLASAVFTKSNNTFTMSRISIVTAVVASPVIFTLSSMTQYLKNNLQQIFRTVLDSRSPIPLLASITAPQQYKGPCKNPLKV